MTFNIKTFMESANAVLEAVEKIAPMASALGIPVIGPAATLVTKLAQVGQAALERPEDLETALTSNDVAELDALIARLTALVEIAEDEAAAAAKKALAEG